MIRFVLGSLALLLGGSAAYADDFNWAVCPATISCNGATITPNCTWWTANTGDVFLPRERYKLIKNSANAFVAITPECNFVGPTPSPAPTP